MAARARLMAMVLTTTTFVCLPFRPTTFEPGPMHLAVMSSARHAGSRSRRQRSSVGMRDSVGKAMASRPGGARFRHARVGRGLPAVAATAVAFG